MSQQVPTSVPSGERRKTVFALYLHMWCDLFSSGNRLRVRFYREWAAAKTIGLPDDCDPAKLRSLVTTHLPPSEALPDLHLDTAEENYIRGARMIAAWMISWSTLVPLAATAGTCAWIWQQLFVHNNASAMVTIVGLTGIAVVAIPLYLAISLTIAARSMAGFIRWVGSTQKPLE